MWSPYCNQAKEQKLSLEEIHHDLERYIFGVEIDSVDVLTVVNKLITLPKKLISSIFPNKSRKKFTSISLAYFIKSMYNKFLCIFCTEFNLNANWSPYAL